MIVNYTEKGWEIITQKAHGLLAAQIAMNWDDSIHTSRWTETLLAIAGHDDAEVELENNDLLTSQGGPRDFKMQTFDQRFCMRTMDFALSISRYTAMLCSMHLNFVYGNLASDLKAKKYLKNLKNLQKKWRKDLNLTIEESERDYHFMEWCDALSLLLCQHKSQPNERSIEISYGLNNMHYQLIEIIAGTYIVEPWPFQRPNFKLYVEIRIIPQLYFKNSDEFRQAFKNAEVREIHWLFQKDTLQLF